jgi:acetyltransferase
MLRHVFDPLFEPRTLLVVGDRPIPIALTPPEILRGCLTLVACQYGQPIMVPEVLAGVTPGARVDLALVCIAPQRLVETLMQLVRVRPRALILLPHDAVDPNPVLTRELCREWALLHDCALLGPNAGLQRPHTGLNLSQYPTIASKGRLALVAQSRGIASALMDWAEDVQLGFSTVVAIGEEAVTRLPQILAYLATDPRSDSIVLYLEEIDVGRTFMSALRAAASVKPVIVLKVGRAQDSALADASFDAVLRRAGAVRVRYFLQLFSALKVLGYARRPKGRRLALMSNANGPAQMALDMIGTGVPFLKAELSATTRKVLEKLLEPGAPPGNPVVTQQPMTAVLARVILEALLEDTAVDGVLVLLTPDARADLGVVASELAQIAPQARKPVMTCFMGDAGMRPLRRQLDEAGTPAFRTPESAAHAFGVLASYHYNQQLLQQMQPPEPEGRLPDLVAARKLIAMVRAQGRIELNDTESQALFALFDVPIKFDSDAQAHDALHHVPLALAVESDRRFGPVICFAAGGPAAGLMGLDGAMDLPPLNRYLARQLVKRSPLWRRTLSLHITPDVHEALLVSLEKISTLVCELPDVETLRVDPLYANRHGLYAMGASVGLHLEARSENPQSSGYLHMAIHPYPYRWVQHLRFADAHAWTLRPIRPEDAQALQEFIRGLSNRSRYMRFVSMMRELTPRMIARYTQIDYHLELALVATTLVPNPANRGLPTDAVIGLAHYLRHPDGRGAEYALVIGDNWQRQGLGVKLMGKLIDAATEQGLEYIDGLVLAENKPMLALMISLGFTNDPDPDDLSLRRVWLKLGNPMGTN